MITCIRVYTCKGIKVYTSTESFGGTCQMLILWSVQFNFGFNSRARAQTVQWHSTETVVSRLTCFKLHGTMVSKFFHPQPSPPWALKIIFLHLLHFSHNHAFRLRSIRGFLQLFTGLTLTELDQLASSSLRSLHLPPRTFSC